MLRAEESTSQHQGSSRSSTKPPSESTMEKLKKMYPDMDKKLVFAPLLPEIVRDNPVAEQMVGDEFTSWLRRTGLKGILWKEQMKEGFFFIPSLGSEANILVAELNCFDSSDPLKDKSEKVWGEYWEKDLQRVIENEWEATGSKASFEKKTRIRWIYIERRNRKIACLELDFHVKRAKIYRVLNYLKDWQPLVYRNGAIELGDAGLTNRKIYYRYDDEQDFKRVFEAFVFFEDDKQYVSEMSTLALEEYNWSQMFSNVVYRPLVHGKLLPTVLNDIFPNLRNQMEYLTSLDALLKQTKSTGIVRKVKKDKNYFAEIAHPYKVLRPGNFYFLYNSQLGSISLISIERTYQQLSENFISLFENHVRLQFLLPLDPNLKHVSSRHITGILKNINFVVIADLSQQLSGTCDQLFFQAPEMYQKESRKAFTASYYFSTSRYNKLSVQKIINQTILTMTDKKLSENMDFSFSWFLSRLTIAYRNGTGPFEFYKLDNELKLEECNGENVFGNKMEKLDAERTDVENAKLIITALLSFEDFIPIGNYFAKQMTVSSDIEPRSDNLKRSPRDTVAVSSVETRLDDFKLSNLLLKESMLKRWEKLYKSGTNEERAQYLLSVKQFLQKEIVISRAEKQSVLELLKSVTMQHCSALTSNHLQGLSVY